MTTQEIRVDGRPVSYASRRPGPAGAVPPRMGARPSRLSAGAAPPDRAWLPRRRSVAARLRAHDGAPAQRRTLAGYAAWVDQFLDEIGDGGPARARPQLRWRRRHEARARSSRAGAVPRAAQLRRRPAIVPGGAARRRGRQSERLRADARRAAPVGRRDRHDDGHPAGADGEPRPQPARGDAGGAGSR